MTSETIRTILEASTFESFASSEDIKEKIASGEIKGVRFGCGDNVNGVYATFDTYEEALEAHEQDVKYGTESAIEAYTIAIGDAKDDCEEHGHLTGSYDYDWIDDAIDEEWGAEEIEAQAKKDAEDFNWVCLINANAAEADRKDGQVCMIY